MQQSRWRLLAACLWLSFVTVDSTCTPTVTKITPRDISLAGRTVITMHGSCLDWKQSTLETPRITSVSFTDENDEYNQFHGKIIRDKCTENFFVFGSIKGNGMIMDSVYKANLTLEGTPLHEDQMCPADKELCRVKISNSTTPTLCWMSSYSGYPKTLQYLRGITYTDKKGANTVGGDQKQLISVHGSALNCDVIKNDNAVTNEERFYKFVLDEESDVATLGFLCNSTYVGISNVSFLIETYGGAYICKNLYRVSRKNKLYMYQAYSFFNETSPSPAKSGINGGINLTIYSPYMSNATEYSLPETYIGGVPCEVLEVKADKSLTVLVPPKPPGTNSASPMFPGNPGMEVAYFPADAFNTPEEIHTTNTAPTGTIHVDQSNYCGMEVNTKPSKMTGLHIAWYPGYYRFGVLATVKGVLYVNDTLVATSTGDWADSPRYNLAAGVATKLEVVAAGSTNEDACVKLRADQYNTTYSSLQSGKSSPQRAFIKIRTPVTYEAINVSFDGFSSSTYRPVIQKVCLVEAKKGISDVTLVLNGVTIGPFDFEVITSVQAALNKYPHPDPNVTFSASEVGNCIAIQYNSPEGHLSNFTCNEDCKINVTTSQQGIPDNDKIYLAFDGVPSPPIEFNSDPDVFKESLQTGLKSMFSVNCDQRFEMLEQPYPDQYYDSFETSSGTTEKPSFCGRKSAKNLRTIFQPAKSMGVGDKSSLCYAALGMSDTKLNLRYNGKNNGNSFKQWKHSTNVNYLAADGMRNVGWKYTCVNIWQTIQSKYPSAENIKLEKVWLELIDGDFYIDSVQYGSGLVIATLFQSRRENGQDLRMLNYGPSWTSQHKYAIKDVEVATWANENKFKVTIIPEECGYSFSKLRLANGQVTSTNATHSSYKLIGGTGSMNVTKISAASQPPTGTYKLRFNGKESGELDVSSTETDVQESLRTSLPALGTPIVALTSNSTCANFDLEMQMVSLPGIQPIPEVCSRDLKASTTVETEAYPWSDGRLTHDPIPRDFVFYYRTTPQIQVYTNSAPDFCGLSDCSFTWSEAITPILTAINPSSGGAGTSLTLEGTQFSTTQTENKVTVDGRDCTVTSSSATEIVCTLAECQAGEQNVTVWVASKGYATVSTTFTCIGQLTSISVSECGHAGLVPLTLTGNGFGPNTVVKVGGKVCPKNGTPTNTQITCTVPLFDAAVEGQDHSQPVEVFEKSDAATAMTGATTLNYRASLTPIIVSISPSALSASGNEIIRMVGKNLMTPCSVEWGAKELTIVNYTAIEVYARTPVNIPATTDYSLKLKTCGGQTAYKYDTSSSTRKKRSNGNGGTPKIQPNTTYHTLSPDTGSLYGGTTLTIRGNDFGTNITNVQVFVGTHECLPSVVSKNQIECKIESTSETKMITNLGKDDPYYSFSETYLEIQRGDTVVWQWITESWSSAVHAVSQAVSLTSNDKVPNGFDSGNPTSNGVFQYTFNKKGVFYAMRGCVNTKCPRNYKMTVNATDHSDTEVTVKVVIGNTQAKYDASQAASAPVITRRSASSCPPPPSTGKFSFHSCKSPEVTNITFQPANNIPRSIAKMTELLFTGIGFKQPSSSLTVKLGSCPCNVIAGYNDTHFKCTADATCFNTICKYQKPTVDVTPSGNALIGLADSMTRLVFVSSVTGFNPRDGSTEGGTEVTLSGFGLNSDTKVHFGGTEALRVGTMTWETKKQLTPAAMTLKTLTCDGVCEDPNKCTFQFLPATTPKITNIAVSGRQIVFKGTNLKSPKSITVGGITCLVATPSTSTTEVSCTLASDLTAGSNDVVMKSDPLGYAPRKTIIGNLTVNSIIPNQGSTNGGQILTISGKGFDMTSISVVDANTQASVCDVDSSTGTVNNFFCTTKPGAGQLQLKVISNSVNAKSSDWKNYEYSSSHTPNINLLTPSKGTADDILTISGDTFGSIHTNTRVWIGPNSQGCLLPASPPSTPDTQITCTLQNQNNGQFDGKIQTTYGFSNSKPFTYAFTITSISPASGAAEGNQPLTVIGKGFSASLQLKVCNKLCKVKSAVSTNTHYVCYTPTGTANDQCVVTMSDTQLSVSASQKYTYIANIAPTLTSVTPDRGGTMGGTIITLAGTKLDSPSLNVTIDDIPCKKRSSNSTHFLCTTGAHIGTITALVSVSNGTINAVSTAMYSYIDSWSSPHTWQGTGLPQAGEIIVLPAGFQILLDTSTPLLEVLVIQGTLIFHEGNHTLRAKYILITDGGKLQIGSLKKPFPRHVTAIIEMCAELTAPELPIYGSNVLAVRNGTLDLHGYPALPPWTLLKETAKNGTKTIILMDSVNWRIGDQIVIATTARKLSVRQNEVHTIISISSDGKTLTLNETLKYEHLGVDYTYMMPNGKTKTIQMRAEVGLLTRNVVFRGCEDSKANITIKACPEGFNPGEFATMTCFQGRFGEEKASDRFGAHILAHAPDRNNQTAKLLLTNLELYNVGQENRLGRYPVHAHILGYTISYIKNSSIHNAFNRATNIHATHCFTVEWMVIYYIRGGAVFFEDGIETGNKVNFNLVLAVIASTSLLNDDITPASFWITNPNNTLTHNHAGGGTHFGFWFRMHKNPDGPSFTTTIFPRKVALGIFSNNVAHSFGWFGLWIFPQYTPTQTAIIFGFVSWRSTKGLEFVGVASIQVHCSMFCDNDVAIEIKTVLTQFHPKDRCNDKTGPMINDSLLVGSMVSSDTTGIARTALAVPFYEGLHFMYSAIYNFYDPKGTVYKSAKMDGTCGFSCSGFVIYLRNNWYNSSDGSGSGPVLATAWAAKFDFDSDNSYIVHDETGDITNITGSRIIPSKTMTTPPACKNLTRNNLSPTSVNAKYCPESVDFIRLSLNNIQPVSFAAKDICYVTRGIGNGTALYLKKRIEHPMGNMFHIINNRSVLIQFCGSENVKPLNFSWIGKAYGLKPNSCFVLEFNIPVHPDMISIDKGVTNGTRYNRFNCSTVSQEMKTGAYFYDVSSQILGILIRGDTTRKPQIEKNCRVKTNITDIDIDLLIYKCYFDGCITPDDSNDEKLATSRPRPWYYWHDSIFTKMNAKQVNTSSPNAVLNITGNNITPGSDVLIEKLMSNGSRWWIVVIGPTSIMPRLGTLTVWGTLEIDPKTGEFTWEMNFLIIFGRVLIGWPGDPVLNKVTIVLLGNERSPDYPHKGGAPVGKKAVVSYGMLDAHGKKISTTWTSLKETAIAGSNQIKVTDNVPDWLVGGVIFITSTSFKYQETERMIIAGKNGQDEIILTGPLQHTHTVTTIRGTTFGASVAYMNRTVQFMGEGIANERFGGRILATSIMVNGSFYEGGARLVYVSFYNMGQLDFISNTDPRYAVAYLNARDVDDIRPSTVAGCAFEESSNSIIGVYGTDKLNVTENVAYRVVGNGIVSESSETRIIHNLIAVLLARATIDGRFEDLNVDYRAGINTFNADKETVGNNHIASANRAAYALRGVPCTYNTQTTSRHFGNKASGSLVAQKNHPGDNQASSPPCCVRFEGFIIYKMYFVGIYYQGKCDVEVVGNVIADTRVGVFLMVIGPSILSHTCTYNFAKVRNNTFIGQLGKCCKDIRLNDNFVKIAQGNGWPVGLPRDLYSAIQLVTLSGGSNKCATKPCFKPMSYLTLCGFMELFDNIFERYFKDCAVPIAAGPGNEDGFPTVFARNLTFANPVLEPKYRVMYPRPSLGAINPSDCVDMECDGLKKCFIYDQDGSLIGKPGKPGSIISVAESGWDGDPRRGVGDYRIPKTMLFHPNGTEKSSKLLKKGIVRNSSCTLHNATTDGNYICEGIKYLMFVIESMDKDTELRRLSPVGVLVDNYIDLINGPQDHGWCAGYTCQKRVSTFHALTTINSSTQIHFSSTNPVQTRFFILLAAKSDCVVLEIYFKSPNRIDIYDHNNAFVRGMNAEMKNGQMIFTNKTDKPTCSHSATHGKNYVDREAGLVYVLLLGNYSVDVKKTEVIMLKVGVPAVDELTFFTTELVGNIAGSLGIPLTKVRVVKLSKPTARRRKRSSSSIVADVEVGDEPSPTVEGESSDMTEVASKLMEYCQTGVASEVVGYEGASCDGIIVDEYTYIPNVPAGLRMYQEPVPQYEGKPFAKQPKIRAYDSSGNVIDHLGIRETPWQITAALRNGTGNPSAVLTGTLTITSDNGWFNFIDLQISLPGQNYIIDFTISYPIGQESFTVATAQFSVDGRPLTTGVHSMTKGKIPQNSIFSLTLDLRDEVTGEIIPDITWRNHTFDVTCNLSVAMDTWKLSGNLSHTFDISNGHASFDDLTFSGYGMVYLGCKVESSPAEYVFYSYHEAVVVATRQLSIATESVKLVALRSNADYNTTLPNRAAEIQLLQAFSYKFVQQFQDVIITSLDLSRGSILVTFTIEGESANVTNVTSQLCSDVRDGNTVTVGTTTLTFDGYITVDGADYYATCSSDDDDDSKILHPGFIALIAVCSALVIGLIIVFLVWFFKIRPKTKTHGEKQNEDTNSNTRFAGGFYYIDNGRTVFVPGPNSKNQNEVFRQKLDVLRPSSAAPLDTLYDNNDGFKVRKTAHLTVGAEGGAEIERSITPTGF